MVHIRVELISPISNYPWNGPNKLNFIAFVGFESPDKITLHRVPLPNIENVTQEIRANIVNKVIKTTAPNLWVGVFTYDKSAKWLRLHFWGAIDNAAILRQETHILKLASCKRESKYENLSSILNEEFYNCIGPTNESSCALRLRIVPNAKTVMKPNVFKLKDRPEWIFNRRHGIMVKETDPRNPDYTLYPNDMYYINIDVDPEQYNKLDRRVKKDFRPTNMDEWSHNSLIMPTDGRVRVFPYEPQLKFYLYEQHISWQKLIDSKSLDMGAGFLIDNRIRDYHHVSMPFGGYLQQYRKLNISGLKAISMKFESRYYFAEDDYERDRLSAAWGNYMHGGAGVGAGTRAFPEARNPNPDYRLEFHIVLIGPSYPKLTNAKFKDLEAIKKSKPFWLEKGEEIAQMSHRGGYVLFMTNRPIKFNTDIQYFSRPDIHKKVLLLKNDSVGMLN